MEILLALAGGLVGAIINQLATEIRERRKRETDSRALERHAVAEYLGAIAEMQHHIHLMQSVEPGDIPPEEAFRLVDSLHHARMAVLTAYGRTRLDVTTVPVRNALDHTYYVANGVEETVGEGSEDTDFETTQQLLGQLNNDISNCCEDLLRVCEAVIGPKKLSRRELKATQEQPSLAPPFQTDEQD